MTSSNNKMQQANLQQGFTLIELSIVLVIIGLIVGGVLVGRDMIASAEIRATVGQYEQLNAAVNTFRSRFNAYPGDIPDPVAVGMTDRTSDGNGLIQDCNTDATIEFGCENKFVWNDLSAAGYVAQSFTDVTGDAAVAGDTSDLAPFLPAARIGGGTRIVIYSNAGLHFFQFAGVDEIATGVLVENNPTLSPLQALQIDAKVDDGLPTTGIATARDNSGAFDGAVSATGANECVNNSAYNGSTATGNTPLCALRVRASF